MLINLSNIPHSRWTQKQLKTALDKYEKIIDVLPPLFNVEMEDREILLSIETRLEQLLSYYNNADLFNATLLDCDPFTAHCFSRELLSRGYECIVPIYHQNNGDKKFLRFRELF